MKQAKCESYEKTNNTKNLVCFPGSSGQNRLVFGIGLVRIMDMLNVTEFYVCFGEV